MNDERLMFSIRVPCNDNTHFYRIKTIWNDNDFNLTILEDDNAFESNILYLELQQLALDYKETYENYVQRIHLCLRENHSDIFLYKRENNEFLISRKQGRLAQQFAKFILRPMNFTDVALQFIDDITILNHINQKQTLVFQNDVQNAISEKNMYAKKLDDYICKKTEMENELYSKFIIILNAKKMRIQYLQEMLTLKAAKINEEIESNSDMEMDKNSIKNVRRQIEKISDSESSDEEFAEKIIHKVQIERSDSPQNSFDFLEDDNDQIPLLNTSLPKRVKMSNDNMNDISTVNNLDYLEESTNILTDIAPKRSNNETTTIIDNTVGNVIENDTKKAQSQNTLNFNTQDLIDML